MKNVEWELFSRVTSYLNREKDVTPWVAMLKCLDMMSIYFPLPESKEIQVNNKDFKHLVEDVPHYDVI